MRNVTKTMIIGIFLGALFVFGAVKCKQLWEAKEREKKIEAYLEAEKKMEAAANEMARGLTNAIYSGFEEIPAKNGVAQSEASDNEASSEANTPWAENMK